MREWLLSETRGVGCWCPRASKNRNDYLQADIESVGSVCTVPAQDTREFYKVDDNAKVSQKLNELDVMNASLVQPLVILW